MMGLLSNILGGENNSQSQDPWIVSALGGLLGGLVTPPAQTSQGQQMPSLAPVPQPQPQPQPQQMPSFEPTAGDRFAAFASGSQNGLLSGLANAFSGVDKEKETLSSNVRALMAKGMDQQTAVAVAGNPQLMTAVMAKMFVPRDPVEMSAGSTLYDPVSKQALFTAPSKAKGEAGGNFGLQPIYGTDDNGNPVVMQLSSNAEAAATKMPKGVTLSSKPLRISTATGTMLMDPITRQPISVIPKDIAGAQVAKETGTHQGKNLAALPQAMAKAELALKTIASLKTHPGREAGTGKSWLAGKVWGTDAYDFATLNKQAKGQVFLAAYESLRGGGAITEVEGLKAEEAMARLDVAQSEEAYLEALNDLEAVIKQGMETARKMSGVSEGVDLNQVSAPAAPKSSYEVIGVRD